MGICRSLFHSFNFVNMRFVVEVIFPLLNSTRRCTLYSVRCTLYMENLLQNLISFFTLTSVPLDEYVPFCRKQFSPLFNKTGNLQVFALYLPQVYPLNTRSIKILQRIVVKALITLLMKQYFYAKEWLVVNICLRSVIGRNIW